MELRFFDDPVPFLDVAGDHLAEQPVLSTVIAGVSERIATQRDAGIAWPEGVPCWFAVVLDGDEVVGTAMRTAPFGEYPAYLMPMSDDAVHLLAKTLLDRDEPVLGANGALPAVQTFCEDMAAATGRTARVGQHTRLFELGELRSRRPCLERCGRPPWEQDLVASWYEAFMADADEQAGRSRGSRRTRRPTDDELRRRIDTGRVFVWAGEDDVPVNVTAATARRRSGCPGSGRSTRLGSTADAATRAPRVRRLGAAPRQR